MSQSNRLLDESNNSINKRGKIGKYEDLTKTVKIADLQQPVWQLELKNLTIFCISGRDSRHYGLSSRLKLIKKGLNIRYPQDLFRQMSIRLTYLQVAVSLTGFGEVGGNSKDRHQICRTFKQLRSFLWRPNEEGIR